MKLAIDGIALTTTQPGGYRTYATNLVHHLGLIDNPHEWVLYVDRPLDEHVAPHWLIQVLPRRGSVGFVWREQNTLPHALRHHHIDLLHSPAATGPLHCQVPLVVTIHDTIEFSEPLPSPHATKRWAMRIYSRFVQKTVAGQAQRILTVSEYSRSCIAELFRIPPESIVAIPNAPAAVYQPLAYQASLVQVHQRFGVSDHILAIASAATRKNTGRLLDAYARLSPQLRDAHPLALVCTHQGVRVRLSDMVTSLGLQRQVVFIEAASDEDLLLLYNRAAMFVFPSLEEGFGLPPLEAMACGTPVVASNTSSLPEVLGDAALLVTPTDTQAIGAAMTAVLRDSALAENLRARGLARSQQFSWHDTARATLAVYEQAAAGRDA